MGSIKIAGKNIVTQSGSDEPTIASNVVFPAGIVLNVLQYFNEDSTSSLDGTQVTLASGSITPKNSSSKILITYHFYCQVKDTRGTAYNDKGLVYIYRDVPSADTEPTDSRLSVTDVNSSEDNEFTQYISHSYLDSPSTDSTITYTIKFSGGEASYDDMYIYGGHQANTLTLMEIAG